MIYQFTDIWLTLADPDIRLRGGHINSDVRLGGANLMFSSISRLFLRWRGPKSIAKLDGGRGRIFNFPPWSATEGWFGCFHFLQPILPYFQIKGQARSHTRTQTSSCYIISSSIVPKILTTTHHLISIRCYQWQITSEQTLIHADLSAAEAPQAKCLQRPRQ